MNLPLFLALRTWFVNRSLSTNLCFISKDLLFSHNCGRGNQNNACKNIFM